MFCLVQDGKTCAFRVCIITSCLRQSTEYRRLTDGLPTASHRWLLTRIYDTRHVLVRVGRTSRHHTLAENGHKLRTRTRSVSSPTARGNAFLSPTSPATGPASTSTATFATGRALSASSLTQARRLGFSRGRDGIHARGRCAACWLSGLLWCCGKIGAQNTAGASPPLAPDPLLPRSHLLEILFRLNESAELFLADLPPLQKIEAHLQYHGAR